MAMKRMSLFPVDVDGGVRDETHHGVSTPSSPSVLPSIVPLYSFRLNSGAFLFKRSKRITPVTILATLSHYSNAALALFLFLYAL
jgi:hypothetical protein